MSSFVLKIIAIITMFCDHLGDAIYKRISPFNYIGRIAFPIFAFQISEGFLHTKNLKNYFINKYGAITDVDFSDIFEEYMNQERK